ncbi:hypothetical protein MPER_10804, partial [Moniliophthora perniciosa FA553]
KNRSAKVQKEVQRIQQQQQNAGKSRAALEKEKEKELRNKQKAEEEKRRKEEAALLKPVISQKVPFGADPKTVLCAYFKAGQCDKGSKCKFSHDVDIGRKVEKNNLYADTREEKMAGKPSWSCSFILYTMDQWDEEKLRSVVLSKHGNPQTTTDASLFSLLYDALKLTELREQIFGWFWECPNGDNCQYRHALPPGFVLKSQKKAADEAAKANTISLEDFLEVERHKLGSNLTPVTLESFAKWKKTRMDKKQAEDDALRKAKEVQNAAGKNSGMSGRDLFQYNPEWFEDSDDDAEDDWDLAKYRREKEEEDLAAEEKRIADLALQDGYHEDGA